MPSGDAGSVDLPGVRQGKETAEGSRLGQDGVVSEIIGFPAVRLYGMCERAESPEQPLGQDVIVPDRVPLSIEFDRATPPIGMAALRRDEHGGIWAEVTGDDVMPERIKPYPYFAVGIAHPVISKDTAEPDGSNPLGRITAGEITHLAVVRRNADPGLPPYEVVQ
jgi:hypothetical protein